MNPPFALPEGRPGRLLAAGITLLALALIWLAILSPLLGWYRSRAETLAQQQALAARMTALAHEIPELRDAVAAARPQLEDRQLLLAGSSQGIAAANLQSALQGLAAGAGTSLDSSEVMPVQALGALHEIGVQLGVTATWPVLIAFLQAIDTARPRMIIGQLSVADASQGQGTDQPLQASFSVSAFSAATQ